MLETMTVGEYASSVDNELVRSKAVSMYSRVVVYIGMVSESRKRRVIWFG